MRSAFPVELLFNSKWNANVYNTTQQLDKMHQDSEDYSIYIILDN